MIRNFSFTLDDIVESIAKTTAAQLSLLDTLAKVVSDNRIVAVDYLLVKQGVSVLWPTPPVALGLILLEKLKLGKLR